MVLTLFLLIAGVSTEGTCGGELAKFVAYHVFGDVYGDEFISVMNSESMANKLGRDHRCATPCFDDCFFTGSVHVSDFFLKFDADERSFF